MRNLKFEDFKKICTRLSYLVTLMGTMILTGCGGVDTSSDLYQNIQQQTQQLTLDAAEKKQYSVAYVTEKAYEFCNACKQYAPTIIVASILIGVLLLHIISEDQAIRRKAIMIFFFGIPGVMLLLAFGLSWLVGAFL